MNRHILKRFIISFLLNVVLKVQGATESALERGVALKEKIDSERLLASVR